MKKTIIIDFRFALYFKEILERPDGLTIELQKEMGENFTQIPIVTPVPNSSDLLNIPVVEIRSNDGHFSITIARKRADLSMIVMPDQDLEQVKIIFFTLVEKFANYFAKNTNLGRFGLVLKTFLETSETDKNAKILINEEFRNIYPGEAKNFTLRYVTPIEVEGYRLNNVVSLQKGTITPTESNKLVKDKKEGFFLVRDFNTLVEDAERGVTQPAIMKIIETITKADSLKIDSVKDLLCK